MKNLFFISIVFTVFVACAQKPSNKVLIVKNDLNVARSFETVEISKDFLGLTSDENLELYGVKSIETNQFLTTQFVDEDGNGEVDVMLFQPEVAPLSETQFEIVKLESKVENDAVIACYSRFVPERTDDYAWENNKVAFRTYGPTAQKMIEDNVKGGTLSSGMDAWLKKVEYPIINKWYEKHTTGAGSYHEDTGEGLDNFHVGISRGVGGIAVKSDSIYHISRNFTAWKTITTGPIRTSFTLTYADWDASGKMISEEKRITLDYGSNLSKFEITVKGTDTIAAGLTLHENDGEITVNEENSWLSYWEPHADSELGTGIVTLNNSLVGFENYVTDLKDASNLFAFLKVENTKAIYYAGFGWKKAGEFTTKEAWNTYLQQFSEKINNPLSISLKNN
ncbi:DUF4861 domain-containing protein [Lutibacter sp. HS1-25]|uniref:DUF4861 family protein n=1 Tax=Lutibacter sp. HS1-25 TaxID=2485000 RepID=UPI0010117129|nr:DUF4861 family protein [Lutibacter sp. HS1-25]RXP51967.1 DUF4861 domain-containing protein [Lutibacter sp. HS1-25]